MFEQDECWPCPDRSGRYIVLYAMSRIMSHFCGLVYNQRRHLCIISPSIYDIDEIVKQKVWYRLEIVLEFWLGQIHKGRIATLPEVKNRNYDKERFELWEFVQYYSALLEENINAFNGLVEAIESRMPVMANKTDTEEVSHVLVDESVLQTVDLPQRFAYNSLRRARRPRFQNIAPGLEVLTTATFSEQPFRSYISSSSDVPDILLFRSKYDHTDKTEPNFVTGDPIAKVFSQQSRITTYPAGLYLHPTSEIRAEDDCIFILPFAIGGNGYAKKSDGSGFGERGNREDSHIDLYRPGYQPFETQHEHSLCDVLKSWRGMVERGGWNIDGNGVAGGMDVWKDANSEGNWEKYVIPRAVGVLEKQRA